MATCLECEYDEIDLTDFEDGDRLNCPECGKELIMIGPDEVELADEDEDDLDEDEDDEEEDEDDLDEDEDEDEEEDVEE